MDPITISALIAGGSALLGGIGNIFGEDQKQITMQDLIKWGYKPYDSSKEITDILKIGEQMRKGRRSRLGQKLTQKGYDPKTSSYAGEEDIINSTLMAITQAKERGVAEKNEIAKLLASLNVGIPQPESGVSKFVGGALMGGKLGLDISSTLGMFNKPGEPGGMPPGMPQGKDVIPTTIPGMENIDTETINNMMNMFPGMGIGANTGGTKLKKMTGKMKYPSIDQMYARENPEFYRLLNLFS